MIIYLAGKITGNPEYRKQFAAAKAELEADGHIVLNPAELPEGMSPDAAYAHLLCNDRRSGRNTHNPQLV